MTRVMTRQLLALLALLTGLAAVGAPAHAADAGAVACEIGVSMDGAQDAPVASVPAQIPASNAARTHSVDPVPAFADLPLVSTAPVLIRIDRAQE
ncbi:MAG: hypothetical protein ABJ242_10710 [Marinomonas sp.]